MPEPLTAEEMARFKREGYMYLIKRNVLDPELCARARDIFWSHNAVPRLECDPFGPFHFHEQDDGEAARPHRLNGQPPPGGTRRSYRWHLSCVGDSPLFVDLVGGAAFPYAEQLLGAGEATPPRASGGVHSTLPRRVRIARPYLPHPMECHVDQSLDSRERLGVVGYIDDVVSPGGCPPSAVVLLPYPMAWPFAPAAGLRRLRRVGRLAPPRQRPAAHGRGRGRLPRPRRHPRRGTALLHLKDGAGARADPGGHAADGLLGEGW